MDTEPFLPLQLCAPPDNFEVTSLPDANEDFTLGDLHMSTPLAHPKPTPLRFTGETGEYFRIWIVNLLLTMITLGVYSAWAKVRKKRYFYGNTWLDGSPFDYLADPFAILKGRLVAFGLFVLYATVSYFFPTSDPVFAIALFLAVPWLVVRALRFNAANSAHRNLRFRFDGGYRDAIAAYIGWPLASALSLGAAVPYMDYRQKRFVVGQSEYGQTRFTLEVKPSLFYGVYVKALGIMVLAILGFAVAAAIGIPGIYGAVQALLDADPGQPGIDPALALWITFAPIAIVYLVGLLVYGYLQGAVTNLVWNHTRLGANRFQSTLSPWYLVWLYLSNVAAIVLSLGFLAPWAQIRTARYRVEHLTLLVQGSLGAYTAGERQEASATGEEASDLFDVGISI